MLKDDPKTAHRLSAKYQYLAACVANLITMGYGVTIGWVSPNIILLTSDDSPLPSGKITMDEASWMASLLCVGGLIGNISFGIITSKFGRKIPMLFFTIPIIISWLLILFAENVYYLYVSRLLNGFVGGGIFIIIPIFLSEIAIDRVRGFLGSTMVLNCNMGILLAFIFGNYFDFYMTPQFVILLTIVCGILLLFFPESPSFLVRQNRLSEAEKSIQFYHNLSAAGKDYEIMKSEVNQLRKAFNDEKSEKLANSLKLSDFVHNPGRKAMSIGIFLALLNQLSGCFAMLNYTANIFKEAGSSMSPNMSAIVIGVIQLLGSCVATNLVDRAGRKFLFITSSVGIALGLITLGVYMMLKSWGVQVATFNFIPIASFSFVIFIASWAVLSLPFLVISEILPEKIKNFGTSFCMITLSISAFVMTKFLPLLNDTLGFHGTMFLFAGFCLSIATFIILYMPETKGRSYAEIMKSLE